MDIQYPKLNTSPAASRNYLDNVPANLGDVLAEEFFGAARFGVDALNTIGTKIESVFETQTLTPDEYRESIHFREGITVPDSGVKVSIAAAQAEAYDRRFLRNQTLDRASQDLTTGALRFSSSLAGSIFDPLNIGMGVLAPVAIGANATARAISAKAVSGVTKKYGVTAGRVTAGAGEGAIGAVAVEPFALYSADVLQDPEYGLFDTFVNIAAGSIFGGVLTGVGGKFSDKIKNARLETQIQAERVAIAQVLEGKTVNVDEPIIKHDPVIGPAEQAEANIKDMAAYERMMAVPRIKKAKVSDYPPIIQPAKRKKKPKTITQFVKENGKINANIRGTGEIGDLNQRLDNIGFTVKNNKTGISLEEMAEKAQEAGFFGAENSRFEFGKVNPYKLIQLLEDDIGAGNIHSSTDPDVEEFYAAIDIETEAERLGIDPLGMTNEELLDEIALRQDVLSEEELAMMEQTDAFGMTKEEAEAHIQSQRLDPDPDDPTTYMDIYDDASSLQMFEDLRSGKLARADKQRLVDDDSEIVALDSDIEKMDKQIQALVANNAINQEDLVEVTAIDQVIDEYEKFEDTAVAGMVCVVG